jgi:hypothetical protein
MSLRISDGPRHRGGNPFSRTKGFERQFTGSFNFQDRAARHSNSNSNRSEGHGLGEKIRVCSVKQHNIHTV